MHAAVRDIVSVLGRLARAHALRSSPAAGRWPQRRRGGRAEAGRALPRPAGRFAARPPWGAAPRTPVPVVESAYARAGTEPHLEEVLRDPIVQLVMRADRLEPAAVRRALLDAAAARRPSPPVGAPDRAVGEKPRAVAAVHHAAHGPGTVEG